MKSIGLSCALLACLCLSPCAGYGSDDLPALLTLETMIERVLYHDPQTRESWAIAKAQAAMTGVRQSAYLPRLNATLGMTDASHDTVYEQRGEYSKHGRQRRLENRLNLSWVLFDFGRRESALDHARQLLIAANAQHDRHLQAAFVRAAQFYYEALAAQRSLNITRQVAALAAENVNVANAKYEAGVAALSDRLQAQTAYSQASLDEVRAEGALRSIKGVIALEMGLPAQTALDLAGDLSRRSHTDVVNNVDDLLEQALLQHPSLLAAKAQVSAARAAIDESHAAGRPTLSFIASISDVQTRQSIALNGDTHARDNSIGLQLSIPLFEGFEPVYQARRARAQLEVSEAQLLDEQRRLSLALWVNYQTLQIESRALQRTAQWVDQSRQALHVIQGRYRSGVGSMIELLNALTAYAASEQQHINALSTWQRARLQLAGNLGTLGFWAL